MSRERERLDEIAKKLKTELLGGSDAIIISSQMGRRHMLGPPGSLNTITPCAACKLLRRRCAEECPFSPYFSPHEPQKFAAVHKVFGASNVSKMLMEVPEGQRADAANSLVYEANVRLRDPVYGCMGAISALQQQLQSLQAELHAVRSEILRYKYREAAAANTLMAAASTTTNNNNNNLVSSIAVPVHVPDHHQMPQAPTTPPPPPPPPLPPTPTSSQPPQLQPNSSHHHVVVVVSSSSSSSSAAAASSATSSLYAPPSTTACSYTTATIPNNNNIPYFD